mgnify:CR=1 FL=1
MDDSRFYMWRCLVALAHGDGAVTPPEREMIRDAVKEEHISDEEWAILDEDMDIPRSIDDLLIRVKNGPDKQDLLRKARSLVWSDDILSGPEEAMMRRLQNKINYSFDINEMMNGVRDDGFNPLNMTIDDTPESNGDS